MTETQMEECTFSQAYIVMSRLEMVRWVPFQLFEFYIPVSNK